MGEAGANMAAHWAGLYGGGNGGAAAGPEGSVVTVSSPTSGGSGGGSSPTRSSSAAAPTPGVEAGRVGKPARRRSRASRRAPVTLLNTDTSNFRAMVQQFTGIPSGPYGPAGAGAGAGPVISFGVGGGGDYIGGGSMPVRPSPTSAVMSFDHLGHHHHRPSVVTSSLQQQQQSQLFRPQQQHQQYANVGAYGGMHGAGAGGDMFLHQGFDSSSVAAEDRLLLQSIQAAHMLPARPASANNTNGYNFG